MLYRCCCTAFFCLVLWCTSLSQDFKVINSSFDESNPIYNSEGSIFYFTRAKHPLNIDGIRDLGDIWFCEKKADGTWSDAQRLNTDWNNRYRNEVVGCSEDGLTVYLNYSYDLIGNRPRHKGISMSRKRGAFWSRPQAVQFDGFGNRSEVQQVHVNSSAEIMIISMESAFCRGAEDLYVSFKKGESWSAPINLGSTINTKLQEQSPYLSEDTRTLFFSSNGHGGKGSKDLFYSTRLDNSWKKWSTPKNLKSINSDGRDWTVYIDEKNNEILFSSTVNSEGYGDLQRRSLSTDIFELEEIDLLSGVLLDTISLKEILIPKSKQAQWTITDSLISVSASVKNLKSGQPINDRAYIYFRPIGRIDTLKNIEAKKDSMNFYASLEPGLYEANITARGFVRKSVVLEIDTTKTDFVGNWNFALEPIAVGSTFKLENIMFRRGSSILVDSTTKYLVRLENLLADNPEMKILLKGHTDNVGDPKLNTELSRKRAEAVKKHLVTKGVDDARIVAKGLGGKEPIASNRYERTRQLNRRVECEVLKN